MSAIPVIAIFDVGKTNKKVFFFDEQYKIVLERSAKFDETTDEDGDACEDVDKLASWIKDTLDEVSKLKRFDIKAINFSAYGASFVHLDENDKVLTPLYNYLKPFPADLKEKFYKEFGDEHQLATETASPVLGNLNSAMQIYRLKYQKPELFKKIKYSLHLPQYLSFLVTGKAYSDITSVGSHTMLWDFPGNDYHKWVKAEGILEKLAPFFPADEVIETNVKGKTYGVGVGLHDSSAALVPFFANFQEPFILISTGTWCISLNPFNSAPLTAAELDSDCLCYISYKGKPVKASRLFAGHEHEQQTSRIAAHFKKSDDFYKKVKYNSEYINKLKANLERNPTTLVNFAVDTVFGKRDITMFASAEEAYHQLMLDIISQQLISTKLVLKDTAVRRIFVDGGFSNNIIYMQLLASAFPDLEIYAASVAQATAMGAALSIHKKWNNKTLPSNIIELKYYADTQEIAI